MTPIEGTLAMTYTSFTTAAAHAAIEDLDLTPEGLADAPAHEEEPESLVHTGNS
jgi:hypothetical protein